MRVDFYQLSRDPAEGVVPFLALNTLKLGERLLVVSGDAAQRGRIGEALWTKYPESFLANGEAGAEHADKQPILLSDATQPANGARYLAIADGLWREATPPFLRTFYLFDEVTVQGARDTWRLLGSREGVERRFWKQDGGKWVEGP